MEFYCRPHFSQHQQRGYARGVAEGGAFEAQHHPPFAAGGSYAHHHQPFSDPTFGGMEEDEDMSFPIWLLDQTHLEESQACEYYDQYYSSSPHQSSFYPYVASPQRLGLVDFDPSFSPAAHSDFDAGGFEVGFPPSRRSSQGSGSYEGGGDEAGMEDADEAQRLKKERRRANNRTSARTFREKKRVEMENQKATLEAKEHEAASLRAQANQLSREMDHLRTQRQVEKEWGDRRW